MKREFEKPAKKNPKFWNIEVTEKSYTITEGQAGNDAVKMTSKDFANETKCLMAVATLVERMWEKGYKEDLPEYSEWVGTRREYAIWRNTEAVEFILKILKENSTVKSLNATAEVAAELLDELAANAKDLEIQIEDIAISLRMKSVKTDPYSLRLDPRDNTVSVRSPYWSMRYDSVLYTLTEDGYALIKAYFNENKKGGKWLDPQNQQASPVEEAVQKARVQKKEDDYLKKLRAIVNKEYKGPYINLAITLSVQAVKHSFTYATPDQAKIDILPVVFDCAKRQIKANFQQALAKTYCMLFDLEKQLPLAVLKTVFEDLSNNKEIVIEDIYKDLVFEEWEKPEVLKDTKVTPAFIEKQLAFIGE